eukprot:TRINITY_DN2644_c0_g1_i2.p1 TRINITY_DN2644_c0_g1~~TRINITY_DN2644_c0_g1_i2.p1  ORF type:complete len:206 (+),score=38.36 TRINITY_DN2644_c0_g1_i2:634-1251(+)
MDLLPEKNEEYKTKEYWETRYGKDKGLYDWFKGYKDIEHIVKEEIQPSDRMLHIGCGNSKLSEDLYLGGFKQIVNIDFSDTVIKDMEERYKNYPEMKWEVMDMLNMSYEAESFDIVLDKGTMDALSCEQINQWEIPDLVAEDCDKMCTEISRVLKPNGKYIQITFGQPHFRKKLLEKPKYGWDLKTITIGDFFHYFVYIMTKKPQ